MPSVEEVYHSNNGAYLFNGITRMRLVDRNDNPVLFSKRVELTKLFIGMLLEAGYVPDYFMHSERT